MSKEVTLKTPGRWRSGGSVPGRCRQHVTSSCSAVLALVVALAGLSTAKTGAGEDTSEYLKYYNVEASVGVAEQMLKAKNVSKESRAYRLAVMLLFSHPLTDMTYGPCLKTCLQMYASNLLPETPTDIFLFVKQEHLMDIIQTPWITSTPNMYVIVLDETDSRSWKMPTWIRPEDKGWSGGFTYEYRLMGQWRLAFSFPFIKELGYKYMLQSDSDTFITTPIKFNMVQHMQDNNLWMTNRPATVLEQYQYYQGLPELASFWLVTRKPTNGQIINKDNAEGYGISPDLFDTIYPHDITGLRFREGDPGRNPATDPTGRKGWLAKLVAGNFNAFSIDWWFSQDVQDFVQLVLRTGAHIEHRWVDIATETMVRDLFCPLSHFHTYDPALVSIEHGKGLNPLCRRSPDWLAHRNNSADPVMPPA
ncbi:hypothetical protein FOA52_002464 [Chlamydomonas sp. UWO 241]|nr:hypothetical protein FOA52_002464 [Chlamydomonas sp. UWO 241]